MFNFNTIGAAEVNHGNQLPDAPVLTIQTTEDFNTLSWTSPYFTNFFRIYWSNEPFTSIDEEGVNEIIFSADGSAFVPGATPDVLITYVHEFPASYSLSVLYYSVYAYNNDGGTLSNQVDSYNFRIAIYESIYQKTIDDMTLRFTPELRRQYQDSILWRSFVQSLCAELAQGRFEIKEAVKQLNIQKAVTYFLNMWSTLSGIARQTTADSLTGEIRTETDIEYRQRLIDNIFWDKISNIALKKTMLTKLGFEVDVVNSGLDPSEFDNTFLGETTYETTIGNIFIPGETFLFLFTGPNKTGTVVSDISGTLTYSNCTGPTGMLPYILFGSVSAMFALPTAASVGTPNGTITHEELINPFLNDSNYKFVPGNDVRFYNKDLVETGLGKIVSYSNGVLKFTLSLGAPGQYDVAEDLSTHAKAILLTDVDISLAVNINSKLLSNIYRIDLGSRSLSDAQLNEIYDYISAFGSIGNVLIEILQDVSQEFSDWDVSFGNIYYGPIFMAAPTYSNSMIMVAGTPGVGETAWTVGTNIYLDNQYNMGTSSRRFYNNNTPDDIVILTRTV